MSSGGGEPLANRMRPRILEDFIGQEHILAPGRLLRRAIQADRLTSLIFYGPPGTGKTTLAKVIAGSTKRYFENLNAVMAGIADLRRVVDEARRRLHIANQQTLLFIDEVHRFNKAQQDALLPHVEEGTVILIGATTENPYFEVNKALVSRSRVFELKPLEEKHLEFILKQTLKDMDQGLGSLSLTIEEDAKGHLIRSSNGDARSLLNALELAIVPYENETNGTITLEDIEDSIQSRAVLYDKDGDIHYDTISAFIKSIRGSDPDAALYWLAKMLSAGEDPKYLFRRMIILASEDIGLAHPETLTQIMAAAQAFDYVGMPEGRFHLSQACLLLATAPKSNSTFALFDAIKAVEQEAHGDIPNHLKDSSRDGQDLGHGQNYLYPHAYRDHWVAQQYLPYELYGRTFYKPSDQGLEKTIGQKLEQRREVQLASLTDPSDPYTSPQSQPEKNWVHRNSSGNIRITEMERDWILSQTQVQAHHLVLDAQSGSGLLTKEWIKTSQAGVWSITHREEDYQFLLQYIESLPEFKRPHLISCNNNSWPPQLKDQGCDVVFDRIVLRHWLDKGQDLEQGLLPLTDHLKPDTGQLFLFENLWIKEPLISDLFTNQNEPLLQEFRSIEKNWRKNHLRFRPIDQSIKQWEHNSWHCLDLQTKEFALDKKFNKDQILLWFSPDHELGELLHQKWNPEQIKKMTTLFLKHLSSKSFPWIRTALMAVMTRTPDKITT